MKLLSREVFRTHVDGRPVVNGFVSYVHATEPHLMLCTGYEDDSDAYDEYACSLSRDNGATWGAPVLRFRGHDVPGGRQRYAEPAALFDADAGRLLVFVDRAFHPDDKLNVDGIYQVLGATYDPAADAWSEPAPIASAPGRSLMVSFCFPIRTAKGRFLVPACRPLLDEAGQPIHYRGCWAPAHESLLLLGDGRPDGGIDWRPGGAVPVDLEQTSRGLDENAVAELRDGRLALVCRGDNSMFPERPGYKWLAFSEDDGQSWSAPVPLPCDRGAPIESSATGSALLRHARNGRLYWIGNLCAPGVRPRGNYPRTPLVIAEVQEEPFALKRDTIAVVDERAPHEPEKVQMSNFRCYEDRLTGDIVVFVTRYAERSEQDWKRADYYRYRIAID